MGQYFWKNTGWLQMSWISLSSPDVGFVDARVCGNALQMQIKTQPNVRLLYVHCIYKINQRTLIIMLLFLFVIARILI